MAKDEKKGGFFSRFKKSETSSCEEPDIKKSTSQPSGSQSRTIATTPEGKNVPGAAPPKAAVAPPAEDSASSEPVIDTVEAFNVYCGSLVDIGTSQLKVVEMFLGMLSSSLNKIVGAPATKE